MLLVSLKESPTLCNKYPNSATEGIAYKIAITSSMKTNSFVRFVHTYRVPKKSTFLSGSVLYQQYLFLEFMIKMVLY